MFRRMEGVSIVLPSLSPHSLALSLSFLRALRLWMRSACVCGWVSWRVPLFPHTFKSAARWRRKTRRGAASRPRPGTKRRAFVPRSTTCSIPLRASASTSKTNKQTNRQIDKDDERTSFFTVPCPTRAASLPPPVPFYPLQTRAGISFQTFFCTRQ